MKLDGQSWVEDYDIDDRAFWLNGHSQLVGAIEAAGDQLSFWMDGQSRVKLRGHAGSVRITKLNGQCTLDLSGLEVDSVQVVTEMDGQTFLAVHAKSQVTVQAMNGQSLIIVTGGAQLSLGPLNGQSHVIPWNDAVPAARKSDRGQVHVAHQEKQEKGQDGPVGPTVPTGGTGGG